MKFTQYLMPDGRKQAMTVDRSPEIEALAAKVEKAGYAFEVEMLSDYSTISMEVVKIGNEEKVIGAEIAVNGPAVLLAVDKMVKSAAKALKL